jgi:hypothetical protein
MLLLSLRFFSVTSQPTNSIFLESSNGFGPNNHKFESINRNRRQINQNNELEFEPNNQSIYRYRRQIHQNYEFEFGPNNHEFGPNNHEFESIHRYRRQIHQNYGQGSNAVNINCNGPNGCLPSLGGILGGGGSGLGNIVDSVGSVIGSGIHQIGSHLNNQNSHQHHHNNQVNI